MLLEQGVFQIRKWFRRKDAGQPLLVSRLKAKDMKRGMAGPLHLLPEQCSITGLSDELRVNFTVMKVLVVHPRVGPERSGVVQIVIL